MSLDSTYSALQRFNDTEALRAIEPKTPRVLLKLVGRGSNLHLEARDDTRLERLKTFFMPRAYKLENIKAFISNLPPQDTTATATFLIDKKIETRKPSFSLIALFQKALFGKTEIGHGMQNPNTACYLNSTTQALRQSPSFKEFLQTRRHELEQILVDTSPDVTPAKLQIEVQAFSDVVYDKAKTDLPMAIYFVQQYQEESDYAKAIVQLSLINKLQEIYTKLDNATVDENTVQSFRTLIIASGFSDQGTDLSSQEDAAAMLAHLLTSIGSQPFTFTNAISYQSNFAIPMLDMQGKNEQSLFPIALMDVAPNTTMQNLVVGKKVDETIEKNDIVNRDDFLDRNQSEMEEILELKGPITVSTTQTLAFTQGQEPKLLPITLKRYDFTKDTGATKNKIAIPPSLTLEVPIIGQNEVARYRLTAVTVHQGSTIKSGHFYTYATKPDGNWVEYNDSRVSEKTNKDAIDDISHNAYIYYYEYVKNVPSKSIAIGREQARA
ncbi:MAG: hypothetical protein LLF94_05490 [Chlamydiales bacterium]|nr:hypothetical protein [Chlamydiales bacterium]